MTTSQISDIPSVQKTLRGIRNLKFLLRVVRFLRPLLTLLRVNLSGIDREFADMESIERSAIELAYLSDRFNDLLASRGWIVYESMNVDVAKAAVARAESGDTEGAEAVLVGYYDPDTVRRNLLHMWAVKAFQPRMRLAQMALVDYAEERYHACIPVVLALLDGMINHINNGRGFFCESVKLEAWDSIAGHSKGLNALARIFQAGRYQTRTDEITVPYRHGIVHGLDLAYDNKVVAAKTWAALFAAREWAIKAEQGQLGPKPDDPQRSWGEILGQIRDSADQKARLGAWKPRAIVPGADIPATGDAGAYGEGTPEQKLAEFMSYWRCRNYGSMAKCLSSLVGHPPSRLPARVREQYHSKQMIGFELVAVTDEAPALTEIRARISYDEGGKQTQRTNRFRMINESQGGAPRVRATPGSRWTLLNWIID